MERFIVHSIRRGLVVIILWMSTAASVLAQTDPKDWPMYNRDVTGSRHNPGETAITKDNAGI